MAPTPRAGERDGADAARDDTARAPARERETAKPAPREEGANDGVGAMREFNDDDDDDATTTATAATRDAIERETTASTTPVTPETRLLGERLDALDEEAELTVESFLRAKFDAATTTTTDFESASGRSESDAGGRGERVDDAETLYARDTDLEEAEEVDPRVGDALDELNDSMTECNGLENALQEARKARSRTQTVARKRLDSVAARLSSSVMTAVPVVRSIEALRAYESAHDAHERAKKRNDELERELVASSGKVDIELMEACAEAMREVSETTAVKLRATEVHERNTRRAVEATAEAAGLERERTSAVKKALPWFNAKALGEAECAQADERVSELKLAVRQAKARYEAALRALNEISEEVHARREARKLAREASALDISAVPEIEREEGV
jgi:hypothetical protein